MVSLSWDFRGISGELALLPPLTRGPNKLIYFLKGLNGFAITVEASRRGSFEGTILSEFIRRSDF